MSSSSRTSDAARLWGCGCLGAGLALLVVIGIVAVALGIWFLTTRQPPDSPVVGESAPSKTMTEATVASSEGDTVPGPALLESRPHDTVPQGRRMLRVAQGTVVRAAASDGAQSLWILDGPGLMPILDQQGTWYRIASPSTDRTGWVHLVDGASRELRLQTVWQVPRPSRPVSDERLALARRHLEPGWRQSHCGSYPLWTDVEADSPLLAACDRLATSLDPAYNRRYGVQPMARGEETIFLFRRLESFRAFVQEEGTSAVGYAGHASAAGGYLVMYVGSQGNDEVVTTLVHELSHLVSWRALGGPLPRWLSEGLADGLGDTASMRTIEPLRGIDGAEAEARRLRQAMATTGPVSSEALVRLEPADFDASPQDRHYEHSAMLVRFLLLDDTLAPRFRSFLRHLAEGHDYDPERLRADLGISWQELDKRFETWLHRAGR